MNYYLLLLVLIFISYIAIYIIIKPKNKEKVFLNIAFVEMLLFLGLRDITIGTDLKNYIPYFQFYKTASWNQIFILDLEKGYLILNKIISLFGGENFFLFVVAIISLSGVYISIRKYSQNYFFSIFIYITMQFYIFLFSGLRQAIAFSIIWIALRYTIERKLFKFILLVLLASTFHKSAVICLPIYFIATKRITLKYVMIFIGILIAFFTLKGPIVNIVTRFVYSNYDLTQFYGGYNLLLLLLGIFILLVLIRNKQYENFRENDIWFNMLMVAILVQSLASVQGNIARLTMYYSYSLVFLIPNVTKNLKDKKQRILIEGVIYILLLIFFLINIQSESLYIPYKTFLF